MHLPSMAVVVIYRKMLSAAVVPDGYRSHLPFQAKAVLGSDGFLTQVLEQGEALSPCHIAKAFRMARIHVKGQPTSLWNFD